MNIKKHIIPVALFTILGIFSSCGNNSSSANVKNQEEQEHKEEENGVKLTQRQAEVINLKIGSFQYKNLNHFTIVPGQIAVPPQNQASISAIIGANVKSIKVTEGDYVKKGEILATLEHPDLIKLQVEYQQMWSQLQYLEKEFERQKMLYENKVASGKKYQETQAKYISSKAQTQGLEQQVRMLNMDHKSIRNGKIYRETSITSPISGSINKVEVTLGKYVNPQQELFEVLNTNEMHAHLNVFENEISQVHLGQKVIFKINNNPSKEYMATIKTIGTSFGENPKAVKVHATLDNYDTSVIPGLFIKARIITNNKKTMALPEEAVVTEGDRSFIFILDQDHKEEQEDHDHKGCGEHEEKIALKMVEVLLGAKDREYVEITPINKLSNNTKVAQNAAYYLISEMKKSEAEHSH